MLDLHVLPGVGGEQADQGTPPTGTPPIPGGPGAGRDRTRSGLLLLCRRRHNTWDITKLAGPVKGKYLDCYVMIDIYSRYIVDAYVNAHESGELAVEMMKEIFGNHGTP